MKIDKKLIKELVDYLQEFSLTELEYSDKTTKIKVSKKNPVINQSESSTVTTSVSEKIQSSDVSGKEVK